MKKNILLYSIGAFITGFIFSSVIFSTGEQKYENYQINDPIHTVSGIDGEMGFDPMGMISKIQEINTIPYKVYENEGTITIEINLRKFLQTHSAQKSLFIKDIQNKNIQTVQLNVSGTESLDISDLGNIFNLFPDISSLAIHFYTIPTNYYELIDHLSWNRENQIHLSIVIHGPSYPVGFSIDDLLIHGQARLEKMLKKDQLLESFSLELQEAFGIRWILGDVGQKILQDFPTKVLQTNQIILSKNLAPGTSISQNGVLRQFFQESHIPEINIPEIGEKKNGIITIY